jgi:phage tail protein X
MTTELTSLTTTYLLALRAFGEEETHEALKEHYSDVCSHGDVVINDMIDTMYAHHKKSTEALLAALKGVADAARFAYHLESTLQDWLKEENMTPDAWWAS